MRILGLWGLIGDCWAGVEVFGGVDCVVVLIFGFKCLGLG